MGVLQHVANIEGAIGEMNRAGKDDGELLIVDERRAQRRISEYLIGSANVTVELFAEYFLLHLSKKLNS